MKFDIEVGDTVEVNDPKEPKSAWQFGFVGTVDKIRPDMDGSTIITVLDADGEYIDVTPNDILAVSNR